MYDATYSYSYVDVIITVGCHGPGLASTSSRTVAGLYRPGRPELAVVLYSTYSIEIIRVL